MNPGPLKCSASDKTIARNNRAVECNVCHRRLHINGKVKPTEFDRIRAQSVKTWTCPCCLDQLKSYYLRIQAILTWAEGLLIRATQRMIHCLHLEFVWFISKKHLANTKIGHINANSIVGFKFHDIWSWLLSGRFDGILLITETNW